ncbi:trypsin-like protein [Diaporthe eres]|nr:trypsin-like protein [Diaporthe eres]
MHAIGLDITHILRSQRCGLHLGNHKASATPQTDLATLSSTPTWWYTVMIITFTFCWRPQARKSIGQFNLSRFQHVDLEEPMVIKGTGFYVQEEKGFVLTNKHLVSLGPCFGFIVFDDIELEIRCVVYTDPELDYAIGQVDADLARSHGIKAIPLAPEGAKPGVDLRCLGNDEALGLSIGQATISRTDVEPEYNHDAHCLKIFNCETIQAAFSSVGGSSGSPALNIKGEAVGLMMGGRVNSSNNFLLGLHYPQMVIEKLTTGKTIPRGTIQVQWTLQKLHESQRYGLPAEWIIKIREQGRSNAIVAEKVLEGGPAHGKIEAGDILLEVDQDLQTDLWRLSMYKDNHIGREVSFRLWRRNQEVQVNCSIGDLHAISTHHLISYFGATFHPMEWMTASWANHPIGGVYVTGEPMSNAFKPHHLLESINNHPTPNMESLLRALQSIKQGSQHISTIHRDIKDRKPVHITAYLPTNNFKLPQEMWREPLEGGGWVEKKMATPSGDASGQRSDLVRSGTGEIVAHGIKKALPENGFGTKINEIFHGMVSLHLYSSVDIDGCGTGEFTRTGLLLEHGLVVTRRGGMSFFDEVKITLSVGTEVRAHVIFMHEAADFTLIKYNTADAPHVPDLKPVSLSERRLEEGDNVYFASFDNAEKKVVHTCVELISHRTFYQKGASSYLPFHHETVLLTSQLSRTESGVILYDDGTVAGLQQVWPSHTAGEHYFLPASRVDDVFELWKSGQLSNIRFQDFDVKSISHSDAFWQSLPDQTVFAIAEQSSSNQLLVVDRVPLQCTALNGKAELHPLRKGDIILELDKEKVMKSSDLRYVFTDACIPVRVLRDGRPVDFLVPTIPIDDTQMKEFVYICGATIHKPSLRARLRTTCRSEIYVAATTTSSPADMHELPLHICIDRVNGKEVATMEDFKSAINVPDKEYFTLRTLDSNTEGIVSLKKWEKFFPSFIYAMDGCNVTRTAISCIENVDNDDDK